VNNLQDEEDKASRLSKTKTKLENTIAETNDELEREKRLRSDTEKNKRKVEADLKVCDFCFGSLPAKAAQDSFFFTAAVFHSLGNSRNC